jgi:hypothetical protein
MLHRNENGTAGRIAPGRPSPPYTCFNFHFPRRKSSALVPAIAQ